MVTGLAAIYNGVNVPYVAMAMAIILSVVAVLLSVLGSKDKAVSGYRSIGGRMRILTEVSKHDKAFMPQVMAMIGLLNDPGFRTRLNFTLYTTHVSAKALDEAIGRLLARLEDRRRKTSKDTELRASLRGKSESFNVHMTIAECPQDFLTVIEALHLMKLFDDIRRVRFLRIAQQLVDDDYEERGQPLGLQGEHLPSTKYANLR
jgi:hypothetical protein